MELRGWDGSATTWRRDRLSPTARCDDTVARWDALRLKESDEEIGTNSRGWVGVGLSRRPFSTEAFSFRGIIVVSEWDQLAQGAAGPRRDTT